MIPRSSFANLVNKVLQDVSTPGTNFEVNEEAVDALQEVFNCLKQFRFPTFKPSRLHIKFIKIRKLVILY